jgi:hypothetical protein
MAARNLSKSNVAEKTHTSSAAVDSILPPDYHTSIGTLERFASALGKSIHISVQ